MALRANKPGMRLPMRVWDAPTRLFHWAIVVLVALAYASISLGAVSLHLAVGYAVLTLLLFRLAWGIVGSETARFRALLRSPAAGLRQLARIGKAAPDNEVGHNAACGWMTLLLLLLLAAETVTGLCAAAPGAGPAGPLARHVGQQAAGLLSRLHAGPLQQALLAAIALHLLAVVAYATLKRQNLLRPMITGKKMLPAATRAPRMAPAVLAWLIVVVAAIAVWLLATRA